MPILPSQRANPARADLTPRCAQSRPAYLVSATHSPGPLPTLLLQTAFALMSHAADPIGRRGFMVNIRGMGGECAPHKDAVTFRGLRHSIKTAPVVPPGTQEGGARSPTE